MKKTCYVLVWMWKTETQSEVANTQQSPTALGDPSVSVPGMLHPYHKYTRIAIDILMSFYISCMSIKSWHMNAFKELILCRKVTQNKRHPVQSIDISSTLSSSNLWFTQLITPHTAVVILNSEHLVIVLFIP